VKPRSAISARLPDFVEPMKAKLVGSTPPGHWIYEIKFDGYRALALRGGPNPIAEPKGSWKEIPGASQLDRRARCP
jgi:hypothetical protein